MGHSKIENPTFEEVNDRIYRAHAGEELMREAQRTTPSNMKTFSTGAVRSNDADEERWDLISPTGLRAIAKTCAEGAKKYKPWNWEKGMEVSGILNHCIRHIYLWLDGDRTEDHLGHAGWNILAAIHSLEKWPELNKEYVTKILERHRTPTGTQTEQDINR
jgi:hypothetical protein